MINIWESDETLDEEEDNEVDLPKVVFCRKCDAEVDDESMNCPVCGRMLDHAALWANHSPSVRWLMKLVVVLLLASLLSPFLIWFL